MSTDQIQEVIRKKVDPHELGIHEPEMRPGKNGVVITATSKTVLKNLETYIVNDPELGSKMQIQQPKLKRPEVKVIGIEENLTPQDITRKIISQNGLKCSEEDVKITDAWTDGTSTAESSAYTEDGTDTDEDSTLKSKYEDDGLKLADGLHTSTDCREIGILVRSYQYWQIMTEGIRKLEEKLTAAEAIFDWTVQGKAKLAATIMKRACCCSSATCTGSQVASRFQSTAEVAEAGSLADETTTETSKAWGNPASSSLFLC
ncbi:hypothetical protein HPB52_001246 [Rhipicephalus sanguineus]|uniref:Uncharacterized protein n=1 Tax=Rhipicephalus sanguineus TaxID=34632 RepID=A0A9D4SX96_RHISA|nr:hypothetical protein HPB52_001246 [Rhipicephalus sanguineus]